MKNTIVAIAVALIAVFTLSATPASAEEDSLYAFAVQGSPGYIQINYATALVGDQQVPATWTIEGQTVEVTPPASRFFYPGGIQAEVVGTLPTGTTETFFLQVNPGADTSCLAEVGRAERAEAQVILAERKITSLQAKVRELRERLRARR